MIINMIRGIMTYLGLFQEFKDTLSLGSILMCSKRKNVVEKINIKFRVMVMENSLKEGYSGVRASKECIMFIS